MSNEKNGIDPFIGWKIADDDIQRKEHRDFNDEKRTRIHLAKGRGYCDVVSPDHEAVANLLVCAPDLLKEMERYLPILERLEKDNPGTLVDLTEGTGIATANAYRLAIARAKGETP